MLTPGQDHGATLLENADRSEHREAFVADELVDCQMSLERSTYLMPVG
jgi:hypothetical protein